MSGWSENSSFLKSTYSLEKVITNYVEDFLDFFREGQRRGEHGLMVSFDSRQQYPALVKYLRERKILAVDLALPFVKNEFEIFEFVDFVQATPENVAVGKRSLHQQYNRAGLSNPQRDLYHVQRFYHPCKNAPAILLYQRDRNEFALAKIDKLFVISKF